MDHSVREHKQVVFREKIGLGEGVAMRLEQRLRALESAGPGVTEAVVLHFPDGSTRRIPGGDYMVDLLTAIGKENVPAQQRQHLDWVRACVAADEPDGGRMFEVLKCILHGPAKRIDQQMSSGGPR